jgi:hypothetical protein
MTLEVHRVQVWCGEIPDRPGAAAAKLETLQQSGADLALIFSRPNPHKPETAILCLAPITGPEQIQAARSVDLGPALDVFMLVVQGRHRTEIGFEIMSRLAIAGINLRGFSLSSALPHFSAYLAFDDHDDLTHAVQVLATIDA